MAKVRKLKMKGLQYVDKSLLEGDDEISDERFEKHFETFEADVNLDRFEEILDEAMNEFDSGDTDMDQFVAREIHQALNLTRRQAAQPEFWNYLSLYLRPDFVRYRWTSCARKRFVARRNMMRQCFSRLWWIAERTVQEEDDYSYTEKAFANQDIAQNIFDNNFSHYQELLPPVLDRLAEERSNVAKKYAEILNRRFAVRLLEDLDGDQLEDLAEEVLERAREEAKRDQ